MNQYRFNLRRKLTPGIRVLIIANALIFLFGWIFPELNKYMVIYGGLVPELFTKHFFLWQSITYMFLHGGFMHLLFNMFALWMFGTELEKQWGPPFFLKFYFQRMYYLLISNPLPHLHLLQLIQYGFLIILYTTQSPHVLMKL